MKYISIIPSFYLNFSIILFSVVTATNRVSGSRFSLTNGLSGWTRGVKNIIDILIGLPLMHNPQLERKLHDERSRYLVAELKCPTKEKLSKLITYLAESIERVRCYCPNTMYEDSN